MDALATKPKTKAKTAQEILNIEIGDRIIKVCVTKRHGKNYQIIDSFMFQTPEGTVSDGQITNPEEVAATLSTELELHGAQDIRDVIFTLNAAKIATREVMLPAVKENKLKSIVETNAADYFPVDMSTYKVTFNLLEKVEGDNPGNRVLVMAAPVVLVDSYLRLAETADFKIEALDLGGNSQYQVLRAIKCDGAVMYVDVNVTGTLVTFMNDGVMLLQRNFPAGGDEIISAVMHAANRGDEEYLKTMQDAGNPEFLNALMDADQQNDCMSRLISGIVRSADFFKSDHTETAVTKVVLVGTCSHIAGLREEIEKEIGIETVLLNDVEGVQFVANSADGVSAYISCIGSLLSPLDLLPEEYRAQKKKRFGAEAESDPIRTGKLVGAIIAGAGLLLALFAVGRFAIDNTRLHRMQARMAELAYVQDICDTYVSYQNTDASLDVVKGYAADPNSQLTAFLRELEMKMPSSVLVLSATCDSQGVSMDITTATMGDAAKVLSQLRTFDSIAIVSTAGISEKADEAGTEEATFSVACKYKSAVEAEQAAANAAAAQSADTAQADTAG